MLVEGVSELAKKWGGSYETWWLYGLYGQLRLKQVLASVPVGLPCEMGKKLYGGGEKD